MSMLLFNEFRAYHPDNQPWSPWTNLQPLDPNHIDFIKVEMYFYSGWVHPHKVTPEVKAIYKIITPEHLMQRYHQYKASVTAELGNYASADNPANEYLLFHGTNRACLLGEDQSHVDLCTLPNCHLCSIVRNSFDISKCGTKNSFSRFGTGIYTTTVSSKADDYCRNERWQTPNRVVLLNRVVVGNAHRRVHNAINLTSLPKGYHSVVGDPGQDLNYQETVVYTDDAIRPAYLVVYGKQLKPKIKIGKAVETVQTLLSLALINALQ